MEEHKQIRRAQKAAQEDEDSESDEDEAERRARLRRTEQESDLKHAEDLFGEIDLNKKRGPPKAVVVTDSADPTNAIDLSAMPLFKPSSKDQFTKLTSILVPLLTAHSKKAHFAIWAQDFTKQLVKDLPSGEVKKIASALTTMSNEKMKQEREADKGSKKSKAAKTKTSLNTSRENKIETYDDDDGLGDDDFM